LEICGGRWTHTASASQRSSVLTKVTDQFSNVVSTVQVGRGSTSPLHLDERSSRSNVVVLTQPGAELVARRCAESLRADGYVTEVRVLPDREAAKTWSVVADVHGWLAKKNIGRADTIVAVGGGSLTDVAGFIASTWLRGIEAVYVPTTLLGAVDASIGGKTGINLAGKNLVGSFSHPASVIIDLDVLDEVSDHVQREGWAEIYKTALISDLALLDLLHKGGLRTPLDSVVARCVEFKAEVVSEDFREQGRRAVLNFGHTIGHAIEFASQCSHGEAVSVGIVAAAAISKQRYGFDIDVRSGLSAFGLPVSATAEESRVRELLALDKKNDSDGVRMVLLRKVGDPIVDHVTNSEIDLALASVGV